MAESEVQQLELRLKAAVEGLDKVVATERHLTNILALYEKIQRATSLAKGLGAMPRQPLESRGASASKEDLRSGFGSTNYADAEYQKNLRDWNAKRAEINNAISEAANFGKQFGDAFSSSSTGKELANFSAQAKRLDEDGGAYYKTFAEAAEKLDKAIDTRRASKVDELREIQKDFEYVNKNKKKEIVPGSGGALARAEQAVGRAETDLADARKSLKSAEAESTQKKTKAVKEEAKAVKDAADLGTAASKKIAQTVKSPEVARAKQKQVEAVAQEAAAAKDLTPTRFPRGQTPPDIRARLDAEHAANQAQYQAAKKAAAERQQLLGQLGSSLRGALGTAAQSPFGRAYGPTIRELRGSQLPLADRRLTGVGAPMGAVNTQALQAAFSSLASAADRAAANLSRIAAASVGGGGGGGGGGGVAMPAVSATEAGLARSVIAEMLAFPKAWSQVHGAMRFNEAQFNKDYDLGKQLEARNQKATAAYNRAIASTGNLWTNASQGARGFRNEQDGILGQVKNVIGLAAGYQVLQGIATELGQVFGHLKSGIIGYNAMIEQATVGFTTLFQNQHDQVMESTTAFNAQKDAIDYIQMGYSSAGEAAEAMINTIKEFANVTPFRFPELQDSALRMRAFGFGMQEILQSTKNAETGAIEFSGAVVSVGNAVSALGGGADAFRRITYALGQMKQAGRVYQNDMMQLANAGIGGYKYIANALRKEITKDNTGKREDVKEGYAKLYDELSGNAIETVRRLTTNGQISGEAAARAIMDGMNEEFKGGMEAQSKTFIGALSTVADVSQSLVATMFEPMFKSVSAITYQFGQFLQTDEAKAFAAEMKNVITGIKDAFGGVGDTVSGIVMGVFSDLSNAIDKASGATVGFGSAAGAVFTYFKNGIGAIGDALSNTYVRQIGLAALATKTVFAFQASNPFLSQVMLLIAAIGLMKTAYDQNIGNVQQNFDKLYTSVQPLVRIIQQNLLPALGEFAAIFGLIVVDTLIVAFKALEPAITVIVRAFAELIKAITALKAPVAIAAIALASMFVGSKIVSGFSAISRKITELLFKYDQLAKKARVAAAAMAAPPGYTAVGVGKYRMVTDPTTGKKTRDYYLTGESELVKKNRGQIAIQNNEPTSRVFPGAMALAGGLLRNAPGALGGGLLAGGMLAEMGGAPEAITSLVSQVGTALFGFSMLQNIFPVGSMEIIKRGIGDFLNYVKEGFNKVPWASIGSKISTLFSSILGLETANKVGAGLAARAGASIATQAIVGTIVASIAAVGGVALIVALAVAAAALFLKDLLPPEGTGAPRKGTPSYNYLTGAYNTGDTYVPYGARAQGAGIGQYKNLRTDVTKMPGFADFREGERNMGAIADETERTTKGVDAVNKEYGLLINQQNKAIGNQELLNLKLQRAREALGNATEKFQQLATASLERLLNPETRVNPYTGLQEAGMSAEELLEIEQEMSMVEFTNADGLARSFEEYRDLLVAIKPLSDGDLTNGRLNLKAVNERLKIEKERRKEKERMKALAEAEYDLGLAVLKQYDQSIDPLERAVSLRNAQMKYEKDINDLQIRGVENLVEQLQSSGMWAQATRATKRRLEDLRKGQELVLNEMRDMFEKYNQDVAFILANPNLSAAEKSEKINALFATLRTRLGTEFGLTETVLKDQQAIFNSQIGAVIAAANAGGQVIPEITWTQTLLGKVRAGLDELILMMENKAAKIANLIAQIKASASQDTSAPAGDTAKSVAKKLDRVNSLLLTTGRIGERERAGYTRGIQKLREMTDIDAIRIQYNKLYGQLVRAGATDEDFKIAGFARGGVMPANRLALVGEKGPELIVPESRGLVLNNGISSRILGMLGSGGAASTSSNVTINVNNPVIRNDQDIRKLADQITRAQVSAFRTSGGRLS
jgi:hypothetical protein